MAEGSFGSRQVGTTGHEILNREGKIVAWTMDGLWAAIIVGLLNGLDRRPVPDASPPMTSGDDTEATAREAIGHLAHNGLAVRWELPGEPSEAVAELVESCLADGKVGETVGELGCRYVMKRLADDWLGISGIETG